MKRRWKISLIILFVIILILFLGSLYFIFGSFSELNKLVNTPVDKSCNINSDCKFSKTSCELSCACPDAVNKNWELKCPFGWGCPTCLCELCDSFVEAKCVENQCTVVHTKRKMIELF